MTADEALNKLREGNARFVSDVHFYEGYSFEKRRAELGESQFPLAVVLGCSDSRVPAELVFDQGLGDLFVVRVAGNVAAPSQLGSIEYAVSELNTPLVIVLGHSSCGAVKASIEEFHKPSAGLSFGLSDLLGRIQPVVEKELETNPDLKDLESRVVKANVKAVVQTLLAESELIATKASSGKIKIVGAEYSIHSGIVDFFDD